MICLCLSGIRMKSTLLNVEAKITWPGRGLAAFGGAERWTVKIEADYYVGFCFVLFASCYCPPSPPCCGAKFTAKQQKCPKGMVYQTFRLAFSFFIVPAPSTCSRISLVLLNSGGGVLSCRFCLLDPDEGKGGGVGSGIHLFSYSSRNQTPQGRWLVSLLQGSVLGHLYCRPADGMDCF